jgi:prepilin-type N-terminal cleavage/methylation domain-containing protein
MKKSAFTMLELVMVIVVLGILTAVALPRLDRDHRQEAGDNILAAIRYTQHLALMDDKTNPDDNTWQMTLWQIRFSSYTDGGGKTRWFYTVASNMAKNAGNISKNDAAIDPASGKYMWNLGGDDTIDADESPSIFIGRKYGIDTVTFAGGCSTGQHVAFDHLGRPHTDIFTATNTFDKLMASDCTITFGFESGESDLQISIEKETGFAQIVGQDAS